VRYFNAYGEVCYPRVSSLAGLNKQRLQWGLHGVIGWGGQLGSLPITCDNLQWRRRNGHTRRPDQQKSVTSINHVQPGNDTKTDLPEASHFLFTARFHQPMSQENAHNYSWQQTMLRIKDPAVSVPFYVEKFGFTLLHK
jgi:hypothetical protein